MIKLRPCKRCRAKVMLIQNARTRNWQVLDPDPDPERGNVLINEHDRAIVLDKAKARILRDAGHELHLDHHASCPFADEVRR